MLLVNITVSHQVSICISVIINMSERNKTVCCFLLYLQPCVGMYVDMYGLFARQTQPISSGPALSRLVSGSFAFI